VNSTLYASNKKKSHSFFSTNQNANNDDNDNNNNKNNSNAKAIKGENYPDLELKKYPISITSLQTSKNPLVILNNDDAY
jgi:hypothetical protein